MLMNPDTLPAEPTKQEVYDFVCRHLAAQGYRSLYNGNCAYFGERDSRCAVGCLMQNTMRSRYVEGQCVMAVMRLNRLYETDSRLYWMLNVGAYAYMLFSFQQIHDNAESWEEPQIMLASLKRIAIEYRLDPSILDRLDFGLIMPNPVA